MSTRMVTNMNTGKCTPNELGFLYSLGWNCVDAWRVEGTEPVEVRANTWDRYTKDPISDTRLIGEDGKQRDFTSHYWKR